MIISHRYKFVFIHAPKCGGTTLRHFLEDLTEVPIAYGDSDSPFYTHTSALKLQQEFLRQGWDWNSYFKFSSLRDPWERCVSGFTYSLYDTDGKAFWDRYPAAKIQYVPEAYIKPPSLLSFDDFIFNGFMSSSMMDFETLFCNTYGELLVDYFVRVENFTSTTEEVLHNILHLPIDLSNIPQKNSTQHDAYAKYYTSQALIDRVAKDFSRDIAFGGYLPPSVAC